MKIPRRRRLERKTDYKARFGLLKSRTKRLVVRKTNRYIIAQIVETDICQDQVLMGMNSKELLTRGWPKENSGSLKSLPAAYLTGFLLGKSAKKKDINDLIFDMGMYRNVHKSRIYALLRGALDSGLEITHDPEVIPTDEYLQKNEKIFTLVKKIKEKE